jgi:hypothetical protein
MQSVINFFMQNHKTLHLVIIIGALFSLLIVSAIFSNFVYAQNKFRAKLDADNLAPPVDSPADGVANFKVKDDTITSKINMTGITDVSGAQIVMGKIGQNADPVVDLLKTGEKSERSDGVAIQGNFTASDLGGSMVGKVLADLQSAMTANQTYVNIMTNEHPDGEIGGLIYAKSTSTGTQDITGTPNTIEENAIEENAIEENAIEENDEENSEEDAEESEDDDAGGNED